MDAEGPPGTPSSRPRDGGPQAAGEAAPRLRAWQRLCLGPSSLSVPVDNIRCPVLPALDPPPARAGGSLIPFPLGDPGFPGPPSRPFGEHLSLPAAATHPARAEGCTGARSWHPQPQGDVGTDRHSASHTAPRTARLCGAPSSALTMAALVAFPEGTGGCPSCPVPELPRPQAAPSPSCPGPELPTQAATARGQVPRRTPRAGPEPCPLRGGALTPQAGEPPPSPLRLLQSARGRLARSCLLSACCGTRTMLDPSRGRCSAGSCPGKE